MEAAPAATPVRTSLAGNPKAGAWRRPAALAGLAGLALAHLARGSALLAALAAAYTAKRHLGIDVFPGVDVLPDARIKVWIDAAVRLLDW